MNEEASTLRVVDLEYIGVLDDVIVRLRSAPYGTDEFVATILAEGLLYGAPGLLNDGYLVQNPALRRLLERRDTGFLNLLERDRLTVASAICPASASIERRAQVGVASHGALVASDDWPALAAAIDDLPQPTGSERMAWPSRDMTDGFAFLAKRLRHFNEGNLPKGNNLPSLAVIIDFLDAFIGALEHHHEAPRTQWEKLAAQVWPAKVPAFRSMMDLANLVYHLNISMLLGADDPAARTVVTRDSILLAPLLGVGRVEETLPLPEAPFTAAPSVIPECIAAVLEDEELAAFRDDEGRVPHDSATLAAYLDALSQVEDARGLLVPPISRARIEEDVSEPYLRITHFAASHAVGHVRLTIPQSFCDRHAAKARLFGEAP